MFHIKSYCLVLFEWIVQFVFQSHISENKGEIDLIHKTYNDGYANVYDKAGLLTPKVGLNEKNRIDSNFELSP